MPIDAALNAKHRLEPKVGDYWHEMFCPNLVVVGVGHDTVTVCKTIQDAGDRCWTWDLSKTDIMTREAFAEWPLYRRLSGGDHMGDKCFVDVAPEAHSWVREAAIKLLFGESP